MTLIANPIYDSVFKYMMEDERVAKILLSALLKKEIVELQMRRQEYTAMQQTRISMFRMDFAARIREADGEEHLVMIELQKTWLATETLRFRQYLGTQYLNRENMREEDNGMYGLPIISIYILGHKLGDIEEPVVYVRRRYLDYDDKVIDKKDRFIESLTHDSIIIQIPYLRGRTRNHLERLLNVFDQEYIYNADEHLLQIDERNFTGQDERLLIDRLLKAGVAPDVRKAMEVEDEILSEIEKRDTIIMQKNEEIEWKDKKIAQKDEEIAQRNKKIAQKDEEIAQRNEEIAQRNEEIAQRNEEIAQKDEEIAQKEKEMAQKEKEIARKDKEKEQIISSAVRLFRQSGLSAEEISVKLSLPLETVQKIYNQD